MNDSRFVMLLEDFCKDEMLGPPVYTSLNNVDDSDIYMAQVKVVAGFYSKIGEGDTEPEARESAALRIYKHLLSMPSIHFLPGVFSEYGARYVAGVVRFQIRNLEDKPWRRRQVQQIRNTIKLSDNQRGLIKQFREHKRIRAMEALNKKGTTEHKIGRAAAALGIQIIWEEMPGKLTEPPLVLVKLSETRPELSFLGLDRDDAASNCATYLKTILLEDKEDPELNVTQTTLSSTE